MGFCLRPHWGAHNGPPDPHIDLRGPTSKGRDRGKEKGSGEGRRGRGEGKIGREEGREGIVTPSPKITPACLCGNL